MEDLNAILHNVNSVKEIIMNQNSKKTDIKPEHGREKEQILAELNRIRRLNKSIYEDYREELLSKEEFTAYRQDYAIKEELLKNKLKILESLEITRELPNILSIPWVQHILEYREVEHLDREIVTSMLHEIRVYQDNKIKVVYRFRN